MKKNDFNKIKDGINKTTSPIEAAINHFSSVGFSLDEELRIGLLYTLIYRAAVNSGFLAVNEKKETEEKNKFFVALDHELEKKQNSALTLDELFNSGVQQEQGDGDTILTIKENSRLHRIIQVIQAKPYEGYIKLTKSFPVSNSKVLNDLSENCTELIDKDEIDYIVSGKKAKKVFKEHLTIYSTEDSVANFYSESHAMVHDAIGFIFDQFKADNPTGDCFIPLSSIYRSIMRKDGNLRDSAEKEIEGYVNDMRNSPDITLDYSNSALMHRLPPGNYVINRTKVLNAKIVTLNYNGHLIKCVQVFDRPFLWKHAVDTKKVYYLNNKDYNILDNGKPMVMTEMRLCALRYLTRRIEQLKAGYSSAREKILTYNKQRKIHPELNLPEKVLEDFIGDYDSVRKILMDSLFKACNVTDDNSKTGLRTFVKKVFAYWKTTGKIADFQEVKKGHSSLDSITVTLLHELPTEGGKTE